ncbi:hypothetical protein M427DRAFT_57883 [Gonapodya prolifera JEL478]|uniref:Uncharacterized protein n=1 Tax=Gonapodya prolifera (strain JEL478) TaxID=1344416 RepID=A0A139ABK6_GONPJ|nr:hypothetical protein M427DRAFT_57883 [Gonapodya prolifera JEL478]|eukprot:KXS14108.1 hypothetical protein M427DRAFT_57883 [Gonapodya prolifera JEL478]
MVLTKCSCGSRVAATEWEEHLSYVCQNRKRFYCPSCPDELRTPGNVCLSLKEIAGREVQRLYPKGHPDLPDELASYLTTRCFPFKSHAELLRHLNGKGPGEQCPLRTRTCWTCERIRMAENVAGGRETRKRVDEEYDERENEQSEEVALTIGEWYCHMEQHRVDSVRVFTVNPIPHSSLYSSHCHYCYSSFLSAQTLTEHHCGFYPHVADFQTVTGVEPSVPGLPPTVAFCGKRDVTDVAGEAVSEHEGEGAYGNGTKDGGGGDRSRSGSSAGAPGIYGTDGSGSSCDQDDSTAANVARQATTEVVTSLSGPRDAHASTGTDTCPRTQNRGAAQPSRLTYLPLPLPLRPLGIHSEITCPSCGMMLPSLLHLESHRAVCKCKETRKPLPHLEQSEVIVKARRTRAESGAIDDDGWIKKRSGARVVWYRGLQAVVVSPSLPGE